MFVHDPRIFQSQYETCGLTLSAWYCHYVGHKLPRWTLPHTIQHKSEKSSSRPVSWKTMTQNDNSKEKNICNYLPSISSIDHLCIDRPIYYISLFLLPIMQYIYMLSMYLSNYQSHIYNLFLSFILHSTSHLTMVDETSGHNRRYLTQGFIYNWRLCANR